MNRYIIGSLWDRVNRNGANKNFEYLFEGRRKIDELNYRAEGILNEAQKTNNMNKDVQKQVDDLILHAGESDAEVIQARGGLPLLKDRLNSTDQQLAQSSEHLSITDQIDFVRDLQKLSSFGTMNLQVTSGNLKLFSVNVELTKNKGVTYEFGKDYNDDFLLLLRGSVGNINRIDSIIDSKNWEERVGLFGISNPPNNYTTTIGDKLISEFEGTGISFISFTTNQGGLWEAILNEGTAGETRKDISVYSSTSERKEQMLFEGLNNQKHTITMRFKGQDPSNPVSSPRGWYFTGGTRPQDTARTFNVYGESFSVERTTDALYGRSNKEFAIECRPVGTSYPLRYIPEHDGIGTAFNIVDSKVLVDGEEINWNDGNFYHDVNTIQIIQRLHGVHPSDPSSPLMEITHYHTVKNGVVQVSGKVKFLRDTEVSKASAMNVPYYPEFAKKVKTSAGYTYEVKPDQSNFQEYLVESDKIRSLAIVNDDDEGEMANVALAMTVDNLNHTFRVGEEGRGDPFSWIEHRSANIGKVYFRTIRDTTIPAGYELSFDGRYLVTLLPAVNHFVM